MRVRVRRDWGKEGGQVFTQLGRGKTHEINLAHVYLQQRHLHPLQTIRGWGGEKKSGGERVAEIIWKKRFPDYYGFLFFSLILYLLFAVFSAITVYHPFPPVSHTFFIFGMIKNRDFFPARYYIVHSRFYPFLLAL